MAGLQAVVGDFVGVLVGGVADLLAAVDDFVGVFIFVAECS